jgi:hypothetical protein
MLAMTDERLTSRALWTDAAAVVSVVVAVILAARQLRPLAEAGAFLVRTGESLTVLPSSTWPRAAVWVAIAVAVLMRWRITAALGAWVAVLYEVVVAVRRVNGDPAYSATLDLVLWPVLLAIVAASLLSLTTSSRHGLDLLGRGGRWLLVGAAAVTTLSAVAIPFLGEYYGAPPADSFSPSFGIPSALASAVTATTFAVVAILTLAALGAAHTTVRARVLTLAAAGVVGFVVLQLGLTRPFGV